MFGLVGFYGTAALYKVYRASRRVVNVTVSECAELAELHYTALPVRLYHLAPCIGWILLPHPAWGMCRIRRGHVLVNIVLVTFPDIWEDIGMDQESMLGK